MSFSHRFASPGLTSTRCTDDDTLGSIFPWLTGSEKIGDGHAQATARDAVLRNFSLPLSESSGGSSARDGSAPVKRSSRRRTRVTQQESAPAEDASANRRSSRSRSQRSSSQRSNLAGSTSRDRRLEQDRDIGQEPQSLAVSSAAHGYEQQGSDMEAACLTLALWMIGGLGMGSAAVFGAEEMSNDA